MYKLIIGFHSNQLSERETEIALYDYANYNEKILNNKSIIFYKGDSPNNCIEIINKFSSRFTCYSYENFNDIDNIIINENINILYNIKHGIIDDQIVKNCPCVIHDISISQPYGYKYAVLHDSINKKYNTNTNVVPYMIDMPECNENLREKLKIPSEAIVLGCYGSFMQFDLEAIKEYLNNNNNIYFLFTNTFYFFENKNIIYLDKIIDKYEKAKFINTCDAIIYEISEHEIFSLSVGEFSFYNKPVITTRSSIKDIHLEILKEKVIIYNNKEELLNIFNTINIQIKKYDDWNSYKEYTPQNVMNIFYNVFIKEYYDNYSSIEYYEKKDFFNYDISYVGKKNYNQLFWDSLNNKECISFNTLGFLKNGFDENNLHNSPYFTDKDGIYVNKLRLKNNNLKVCFIHSCTKENSGTKVLDYLLDYFNNLNLFNKFDSIFVNNIGIELNVEEYKNKYSSKLQIINYSDDINLFELPTIKLLYNFSNKFSNAKVLYLHTKGVTYNNNIYIDDWINYMLYFLTDGYDNCINLLNDYDSVGVNYLEKDMYSSYKTHWSGNFWWANSNYIKTLNTTLLKEKHDAEWFILSDNKHKVYELNSSNINHYYNNYPLSAYSNQFRNISLLNYIKYNYKPSAWVGHFEFAIWLVKTFKPKIIVELGVDYGNSTFILSSELDGYLYVIDSFEGDYHAGERNTFDTVISTYNKLLTDKLLIRDNIKFIKGYFEDVAKTFDEKVNILHIDGLHSYEAVKSDFENWFPKTDENSIILFHDIISFPNTVGKYFNELPYYKTYMTHSAGLGILSKNKDIIDVINNNWIKNKF